ncbi:HutD family protein [Sinorhizobium meliloti]|uniref:HutD/Ves family protein n=1 Tax=Rhizobium meliloti TaxID=382 RepID=UPI000D1D78D4|nr:HutD family protein [Sinorhizobium meliloti]MDW9416237.1 HutD family protein [Sinorhizobium meliloti]MDW9479726.1 HutD family protein [Sinorhizobium meliloti]MDW9512738.1 HutD family protein [Sinorhizobium meliloti]MDW9638411.1 HutD family protein [Sinorhizobium meliloti]MDW9669221.1 HutD family protein [Sinorhizobium meliloti]
MARLTMMRILRSSEYRHMPWKNGGGETVEIAVSPDRATIADFDWRISMATVATNGAFSIFPGIDRTLSILEGSGMTLAIEGRQPKLLTTSDTPLTFPADVPTSATLVDGPVTDLNVMTRRQALKHRVRRIHVEGSQPVTTSARDLVLFCHLGSVALVTEGVSATLHGLDAAVLVQPGTLTLSADIASEAFLIEIGPA